MSILIDLTTKQKKNYTEKRTVHIFHADESNIYGLSDGWYEWAEESPVAKKECGTVTVSFLPNEPYRRWLRDQALKNKKRIRRGALTLTDIDKIDIRAVAMFGLHAWTGFKEASTTKDAPYTVESGYNAMFNDEAFLLFICDLCQDEELFGNEAAAEEEIVKN